jgi:hypothetical protein
LVKLNAKESKGDVKLHVVMQSSNSKLFGWKWQFWARNRNYNKRHKKKRQKGK